MLCEVAKSLQTESDQICRTPIREHSQGVDAASGFRPGYNARPQDMMASFQDLSFQISLIEGDPFGAGQMFAENLYVCRGSWSGAQGSDRKDPCNRNRYGVFSAKVPRKQKKNKTTNPVSELPSRAFIPATR
jgi:hypothetical protein